MSPITCSSQPKTCFVTCSSQPKTCFVTCSSQSKPRLELPWPLFDLPLRPPPFLYSSPTPAAGLSPATAHCRQGDAAAAVREGQRVCSRADGRDSAVAHEAAGCRLLQALHVLVRELLRACLRCDGTSLEWKKYFCIPTHRFPLPAALFPLPGHFFRRCLIPKPYDKIENPLAVISPIPPPSLPPLTHSSRDVVLSEHCSRSGVEHA